MKKRILLVLVLVSVVGCVDTPNSVCLEFRNANNEHIDALMMVTSEAQAKRMTIRVFSRMNDRYQLLDKKWDIMETNWGKYPDADTIKAFLEADGLHLYRAEYRANAQRCTLELARIRNLLEQLMVRARQDAQAAGENPDDVKAADRFPALNAIVNTGSTIGPLRTQLEKPRLEQTIANFNNRVLPATFKVYEEKHKTFNPTDREEIVLAR